MWTTRPRTTSPSSNSVTPVPYQSSIRSSAASPPSPRGSPRYRRGSSFFIPPVPPVILFARATNDPNRLRPTPSGAGNNTVTEPRNGVHHLAARKLVLGLAVGAPFRLETERLPEGHRHLRGTRQATPSGPRPARAADVHRHDRGPARHGQEAGAGLARPDVALLAARTLGKHEE